MAFGVIALTCYTFTNLGMPDSLQLYIYILELSPNPLLLIAKPTFSLSHPYSGHSCRFAQKGALLLAMSD